VYSVSIGDKFGDLELTLAYFSGSKIFFTTDISHTSCQNATKCGHVRCVANRNLFPEFRELWSGSPVTPCGDMHQSFIDTLVTCSAKLPYVCRQF